MAKVKTLEERIDALATLSETERAVTRLWVYVEETAAEITNWSETAKANDVQWVKEFKDNAVEIVNTELESVFEDITEGLTRKIQDYRIEY